MLDAAVSNSVNAADTGPSHARNVRPCGSYWAAVHTHPQAERWAKANLDRQGYATFLPLGRVLKRDPVLRTLTRPVEVPLFTGYLFVHLSARDPWAPVQHSRGVARVLLDGDGKPGVVPDHAIAAIQSALQAKHHFAAPSPIWTVGTPCSLADGPLRGHPGVVSNIGRSGGIRTAIVAVLLFGAVRFVTTPLANLVRRDE